jgi:hypothetical protein
LSEPVHKLDALKKNVENEVIEEFSSNIFCKFELEHINKTILKSLAANKKNNKWAKKTEYTMDSPDFNYPKFKESLEKKKNALISFTISAPTGQL